MMLPVKPICAVKYARKDGKAWIYFEYSYGGDKSTLLNSKLAIFPKFWSKKKECVDPKMPLEFGNPDLLNGELTRQYRLIQDIIQMVTKYNIPDKGPYIKNLYNPEFDIANLEHILKAHKLSSPDVENPLDLFHQLEEYIKVKTGKVSEATLDIYRTMGEHLKDYEAFRKKPVTFECLNFDFYDRYTHYLMYDYVHKHRKTTVIGLKQNSISKDIKHLKGFVEDRVNREIIKPINMSFFKSSEEDADAIYLTFAEIAQIYYTDLTHFPDLQADRNRFVLACLTGLRYSDFSRLEPGDVRHGRIYLKQEKSESRIVIPLRKEAVEILVELFKEGIQKPNNADFNKNIKLIGNLAGLHQPITFSYKKGNAMVKETRPKSEWITSHTGRRSFCTNEFLTGTPVKLIMKISGHAKEKDFYKYIKITAEEGAIILEKIWLERNGLQPLQLYLPNQQQAIYANRS